MKKYIIGIIGLLMCLTLSAQVTYTQADSLTICKLLKEAPQQASTLWFARQFQGIPYVAHTLEVNDQEQLVVNTRELDCTTLVETVTALTLCVQQEKRQWADYLQMLRTLRPCKPSSASAYLYLHSTICSGSLNSLWNT